MDGSPAAHATWTWRAQAREAPKVDPNLNPADVDDPADALTMAAMQGNEEALATSATVHRGEKFHIF